MKPSLKIAEILKLGNECRKCNEREPGHDHNYPLMTETEAIIQYLDEQVEVKKDDVDQFLDKAGFKPNPSNTTEV